MPWDLDHPMTFLDEIVMLLAANVLPALLLKAGDDLSAIIFEFRHPIIR
jgi:hypothetical protein